MLTPAKNKVVLVLKSIVFKTHMRVYLSTKFYDSSNIAASFRQCRGKREDNCTLRTAKQTLKKPKLIHFKRIQGLFKKTFHLKSDPFNS